MWIIGGGWVWQIGGGLGGGNKYRIWGRKQVEDGCGKQVEEWEEETSGGWVWQIGGGWVGK